jgi:hypothetical protein
VFLGEIEERPTGHQAKRYGCDIKPFRTDPLKIVFAISFPVMIDPLVCADRVTICLI